MDLKTRNELHELLSALLDGTLGLEEQNRLGELLRQHAQARDLYLAYGTLHAELALRGGAGEFSSLRALPEQAAPDNQTPPDRPQVSRWRRLWAPLSAAAAAVLLILALRSGSPDNPAPPEQPAEPTHQTVAVLLQASGAEWAETGLPTRVGAPLPAGRLQLKTGFAQIEFCSGATVILQGPADLELISPREAFCRHGKLRVTVPPQAHGFAIGSPKLELVDRGTEFGLDVGDNDQTEVHVFQGRVDWYNPGADRTGAARQELITGQGIRLDGADVRPIELNPAGFLTAEGLAGRSEDEIDRRRQAWRAASRAVCRDPSLIVYYPFETGEKWSRTLPDQAGDGRQPHDGAIVGCSWVSGRWPGKKALEFKRVSDRVRLNVPGTFDSVTLVAWVRVDGLPNCNNSLFMTDGWEPGELHWQIGGAGKLILGVKGPPGKPNGQYHAADVFTPERLGQWTQVAVVYDRHLAKVTHYVDGRAAAASPVVVDTPLCVGNAEIGNWNIASYSNRQPIRNLNGCMDEFMLFARALTEDNIRELYEQGKP